MPGLYSHDEETTASVKHKEGTGKVRAGSGFFCLADEIR